MFNLLIGLFLVCTTLGMSLSKYSKPNILRSDRKHTKPLTVDKEIF
jgi:hypothetical protein